ncbi:hypothetical protein TKK_0009325 [Trichogramma kaykai]|uniref:Cytochrome P450 n=1 Tax=Trichogramma kaykai TaxID=54128 RepID=A0ABD2X3B9_9HYME
MTGMVFQILLAIILGLLAYVYLSWLKTKNFWKKLGVKGPTPLPLVGNYKDAILGKMHFALIIKKYYDEYKQEPFVGTFGRNTPMLIVRDPDLIKDVLIKDFSSFPDRGLVSSESDDPFSQNLLNLEHKRWRPLRNKLAPVFSSGKLKDMFYLITDCSKLFEKYVERVAESGEPIECRELTAKYTTDAIGVCAFGLNTNSLGDEDGGFRKAGRDLMSNGTKNVLRRMLREWAPKLYGLLRPLVYNGALDFFVDSMKATMEHRTNSKERRNDFVDLLMDLKNEKFNDFEMTDSLLIAQTLIFFLAGFETSSTTISNALYELALNQEIQDKLRQEIRDTLERDGQFTYDNIKQMKYLDQVVKETLRKYPPGSFLIRAASTSYTFNGTDVTIPKDTRVMLPVWAIHNDADIYPEPEKFDPERFTEENQKSRHPMNYLPFGDGPHNCIGLRFANYQTKIGIATLIKSFRVNPCSETCIPYRVHPRSFIPAPIGGIVLKFSKV